MASWGPGAHWCTTRGSGPELITFPSVHPEPGTCPPPRSRRARGQVCTDLFTQSSGHGGRPPSWPRPPSPPELGGPLTQQRGPAWVPHTHTRPGTSLTGPFASPLAVQCPASPPRTCGPCPSPRTWPSSPGRSRHAARSTVSSKATASSSGPCTSMGVSLQEGQLGLRVRGQGGGGLCLRLVLSTPSRGVRAARAAPREGGS